MNQDPTETRMRELSWRRKLSAAEEAELRAWLEKHPEVAAQWQEEAALNALVERLPDAPVASNFTSRVMEEIEREAKAAERQHARTPHWWQRVLLPRLAFAAAVVAAGLFAYQRNASIAQQRAAKGLVVVTDTVGGTKDLLSVEILEDFDSIAVLGPRVQPDTELLSLLQ
jgi:anti-sigma-K factor RskA